MPTYEYQCPEGHTMTGFYPLAKKPLTTKCVCGKRASFIISAPALHTLDTLVRGCDDPMVQRTHTSGAGYLDPNLGFDRKTGKHTPITSRGQRERLMRESGLYEKPESDKCKDVRLEKTKRTKHFSASGSRA